MSTSVCALEAEEAGDIVKADREDEVGERKR
jgi:hypothetical protein